MLRVFFFLFFSFLFSFLLRGSYCFSRVFFSFSLFLFDGSGVWWRTCTYGTKRSIYFAQEMDVHVIRNQYFASRGIDPLKHLTSCIE